MKAYRNIIEIDEERCDGCGQCLPSCAEGALQIIDGKARLVSESFCDGLGACLGECPQGALRIVRREAETFDPEAVERYLQGRETPESQGPGLRAPEGCPGQRIQTVQESDESAPRTASREEFPSALSHWPVQIHLVPADAPFLQGAHLLVAADCAPVACPRFHQDLLQGRVVLIGCPKFDPMDAYLEKFIEIFKQANIRSVTVATMEVPCCSGLTGLVREAMKVAGTCMPVREVVIGTRGEMSVEELPAAC
jgi:Fe-S-cluster-containing hydrogenase component 2